MSVDKGVDKGVDKRGITAITGATGQIGGQVLARLMADATLAPESLRPIVRDQGRLPEALRANAKQASGYGAFDEMRAALAGTQTLFLIPATEAADRVEQHRTAVDAAVAAGVERIVYLSFLNASENATFTLARDHWHTEQHIRGSGCAWTFLRMNLYMDFIPSMAAADGVIRGPAGGGRVSAILREDVAAACSAVLSPSASSAGHDGVTYQLTGREALTLSEAAALMSHAGKTVTFVDETDEEALASRRHYGAPDFEVQGWISSYQAIRDGSLAQVSADFQLLTGRQPTTLAEYLSRDPATDRRDESRD